MAVPRDRKKPPKINPKDRAEWGRAESIWRRKRRVAQKKKKQQADKG